MKITLIFLLMFVGISMKEEKYLGYKNFGGITIGITIVLAGNTGMQI
jgi:hypothetical protein